MAQRISRAKQRLKTADLTSEAIRLTRQVHGHLAADGEVAGLLALMLLTEARRPASAPTRTAR
jgi:predicted RNA polymerase sigma factor